MHLNENSFVKNFRLNKIVFMYVLNSVKDDLKIPQRSSSVPPILKLAATLKFLGQESYQHQIGQDRLLGMSQSYISICLSEVLEVMEKNLCPKHIAFENSEEKKMEAKRSFYNTCAITGVIGAVDGTHIQIIRPNTNEHLYFNRKLKHSINAMAICDHEMFIRAINGRFGGACHNSHIWNLSEERQFLKQKFEAGDTGTRILGDSGYSLEPWILTPYRSATEGSPESVFNEQHSKGRSIIERTFGLLKARFRCLLAARELRYSPEKAAQIFNVCCSLHNICLMHKVESFILQNEGDITTTSSSNSNADSNVDNHFLNLAKTIRNEIRDNMIRN